MCSVSLVNKKSAAAITHMSICKFKLIHRINKQSSQKFIVSASAVIQFELKVTTAACCYIAMESMNFGFDAKNEQQCNVQHAAQCMQLSFLVLGTFLLKSTIPA